MNIFFNLIKTINRKGLAVQAICCLVLLAVGACSSSSTVDKTAPLRIAVAANVQFAMEEIGQVFERETGIEVETIIGSSGKLTAQIMEGAPFDIFLSADMKYADALFSSQMAAHAPVVYAYGALVAWTFQENISLDDLSTLLLDAERIKKIAIANPRSAPYGEQTLNLFSKLGILEAVSLRLIYGESIAQTNQYINSGAADLGFTAKSIVLSPAMAGKGTWVSISPDLYAPIAQGVVITTRGQEHQKEAATRFLDFLFSEPVQDIFRKYGYEVPDPKPALPY